MFLKLSFCDRLVCFAEFVEMTLLALFFLLPVPNGFLSLSCSILCCQLEFVSALTDLCKFWRSNFQQVSTHAFCSCDDVCTQWRNCCSPKNLCKCTESPSTCSTITSIEWNLCKSSSNHLVTSLRIESNVGRVSKHQNKMSDTDRYNGNFSTLVSQINVNTMEKIFEQGSLL